MHDLLVSHQVDDMNCDNQNQNLIVPDTKLDVLLKRQKAPYLRVKVDDKG